MTWPEKRKTITKFCTEKCFDEDVAVLSVGHLSAIAATTATATRPTTMAAAAAATTRRVINN